MGESALAGAGTDPTFSVKEATARVVLSLKSWVPSQVSELPPLAGIRLPGAVGTVTEGVPRVLCTAPGEWLLIHAPSSVAPLRAALAAQLESRGLALVEVTQGLAALEVSGAGAAQILGSGCGLDFDPARFAQDQCVRTRFAQLAIVIDCIEAGRCYVLYVPRSYAAYLREWLADAAQGIDAQGGGANTPVAPGVPQGGCAS